MVSVIIPSYERYDLLLSSINSVLNQTYKDIEIIVIDDCSKDLRYLDLSKNNDIKYFRLDKRLGYPGKVRNQGIFKSNGDWISFLDDDDTWLPTKLEKQIEMTKKYNFISCDALTSDGKSYTRDGVGKVMWDTNNPTNTNELDINIVSRHNVIINSTVMVSKKILSSVGFVDENYRSGEDYITWLKILNTGEICRYIDEPLINYNLYTHKHYNDNLNN
jgi:teichuronic acid biosynthesis glycosyltransferase TuaG